MHSFGNLAGKRTESMPTMIEWVRVGLVGWLSGGFTPCRHLRPSSGPLRLADHALYIGEKCPYCRCYSISYFSEFQKKVFFHFARLEKKIERLAKRYEPNISEYHLIQMSTLDDFDEFEVKITEDSERKLLVRHIHS